MPKPWSVIPQLPVMTSTPSAVPPAGCVLFYFKNDGKLYSKNSAGVEAAVDTTGGGSTGAVARQATTAGGLSSPAIQDGEIWWDSDEPAPGGGSSGGAGLPTVKVAATTHVVTLSGPQTVDGVALVAGDLVLLTEQNSSAANGIYTVAAGAWSRGDYSTAASLAGLLVRTLNGTGGNGSVWYTTFTETSTVGTTAQSWFRIVGHNEVGNVAVDNGVQLSSSIFASDPGSPLFGATVYAPSKARTIPTFAADNQDTVLQPGLFANRIVAVKAINGVAAPQLDGVTVTNVNAPALQTVATTNFYTKRTRTRYSSTATAGTGAGFRTPAQWTLSATANEGGFFFVCRFGLGAITATNRLFVGMSTTTAALNSAVNPTTLTQLVGFGADSTHTTMRFISRAAGTVTATDLGANFPVQTAATNFYEVRMFVPSGMWYLKWWARRLNDGAVASGTESTNLPSVDALMAAHVNHSNGTTASIVSVDLQQLYIEADN